MSSSSSSGGLGLFGILTVIFVICKLAGVIDWSWWLVFLPLYGGFGLLLAFVALMIILAAWVSK